MAPNGAERAERRRAVEAAGAPPWLEPLLNVAWSTPGAGGALAEALTGEPVDAAWLRSNEAYTGVYAPRTVSSPPVPVFTF